MIRINKRSVGVCILLSIITFGIYGIYWLYLLVKNTRSIQKNTTNCTGEMLCLIFVPFYSLYWWYTRGEKVKQEFSQHNYASTGNGIVYLILAIFGLSIVSMAIMQSDFNSLKSETHLEQRSTRKIKVAGIIVLCLLVGFAVFGMKNDKPVLKVYNAGEYIDDSLISAFEEEYGCRVIYETFDSNESMYTKVMSGEKYDIIIPSDYMIERLAKEELIQEIDKSRITNLDGVIPSILDQPFDPGNTYSIPYFWGNVGILYDTTVVDEADLLDGWELLRNPKYKDNIYMYDSERDSFMIALKALGYSLNTADRTEIDAAYKWLIEQKEIMNPIYVGDDVIDSMIAGSKALAIVYSGDAAYIMSENEDMRFFAPDKGTNLWIDGMVITSECTNTDLAHKWIDFILRPENAVANSEAVGYSSPVESAFEEVRDTVYEGNEAYVPRQDNTNDEYFRYQDPATKKYYAEIWTKVKSQ